MSVLAEMYVQAVSTRKVKAITEELCGHTFSASTTRRTHQIAEAWPHDATFHVVQVQQRSQPPSRASAAHRSPEPTRS